MGCIGMCESVRVCESECVRVRVCDCLCWSVKDYGNPN